MYKSSIQVAFGEDCSISSGCYIGNVEYRIENEKFYLIPQNSNKIIINPEHYYLLVGGSVEVEYPNGSFKVFSSEYSSKEWVDYKQFLEPNLEVSIKTLPDTQFVKIDDLDSNTNIKLSISVLNVGESITKNANPGSFFVVVGKSLTYNGVTVDSDSSDSSPSINYLKKKHHFLFPVEVVGEIEIFANNKCVCIHVERIAPVAPE